jgi:hypothetical protein
MAGWKPESPLDNIVLPYAGVSCTCLTLEAMPALLIWNAATNVGSASFFVNSWERAIPHLIPPVDRCCPLVLVLLMLGEILKVQRAAPKPLIEHWLDWSVGASVSKFVWGIRQYCRDRRTLPPTLIDALKPTIPPIWSDVGINNNSPSSLGVASRPCSSRRSNCAWSLVTGRTAFNAAHAGNMSDWKLLSEDEEMGVQAPRRQFLKVGDPGVDFKLDWRCWAGRLLGDDH